MEALLAVCLLLVLLGVSAVGVAAVRRLKVAELDNAAREIYMAAQNQAVLLSANGCLAGAVRQGEADGGAYANQLDGLPVDEIGSKEVTAYYVSKADLAADAGELLPQESIDPALWQGDFYIVYEPESASVLDVFYAEETLTEAAKDFRAFCDAYRFMSRGERGRLRPPLGHFGGEGAEAGRTVKLPAPLIKITNTETLTVEVSYRVPLSLAADLRGHLTYTATLGYEQGGERYELPLSTTGGAGEGLAYQTHQTETSLEQGVTVHTYTYLLDSLEEGRHFKDLALKTAEGKLLAGALGGDFTVTALLDVDGSATSAAVDAGKAEAADNSLFAKGSGGETACLEYTRHLQNLDAASSGVSGKTAAEQRQDLSGEGIAAFKPIRNDELQAYNGGGHTLRGFTIGLGTSESAGLFEEIKGNAARPWQFSNVRLVNTRVGAAGSSSAAGGLAGRAENAAFQNCWVYWEKETPADEISSHLWDSGAGALRYAITGRTAGGLVGVDNGNVTIENCLAATTLRGDTAGGLVGSVSGSGGAGSSLRGSYADCYLAGSAQAGGLAGGVGSGAALSLENCYSAGFFAAGDGARAAGLAVNEPGAEITADNAYSVMLYSENASNAPLFTSLSGDVRMEKVYYLSSANLRAPVGGEDALGRSYNDLTDPNLADNPLDGAAFAFKTQDESHPYNVQPGMALARYEYPGLAGMPHYGDWGMEFRDGTLVYYEQYADGGTFGLYGRGVNTLQSDRIVVLDGYAVAYQGAEVSGQLNIALELYYQDENGGMRADPLEVTYSTAGGDTQPIYTAQADGKTYYLAPLPGEVVNTKYAPVDYFQQIRFVQKVSETTYEGWYYYNPHFAGGPDTLLEYEAGLDLAARAASIAVPVRSARQLYSLGQYRAYSAGKHEYTFVQQLDIDYSRYTGYGLFDGAKDANGAVLQPLAGREDA